MTEYTDEDLALMHADGLDCPDECHAREVFTALDRVRFLLWMIYADVLDPEARIYETPARYHAVWLAVAGVVLELAFLLLARSARTALARVGRLLFRTTGHPGHRPTCSGRPG